MGLNKAKGNMYPWITHTWNPLAGKCLHGCGYCSTNKFYYPLLVEKYSGEPRVCDSFLKDNLGNDNFIFVVAQNDLFAEGVPGEFIYSILAHCDEANNSYLFQSKNPKRIFDFEDFLPKKSVICTTIETNRYYPQMGNTPMPNDRALWMNAIHEFKKYVTIEPIMDFDLKEMIELIMLCNPEQVNIGADSGNNHLPEPSKEKLLALIDELQKFTTIARKTNLARLLK